MKIELGQAVVGRNGERLGTVAGLVIDSGTKEVTRLVLGGGPVGGDCLVDQSAIVSSAAARLQLDIDEATARQLPPFVQEEHAVASREDAEPFLLPASGVGGPVFYDNPTSGAGYPSTGSFFDPAPLDPPPLEVVSNIGQTEVMLRKGADVVGSDGDKVGEVDEIETGERGEITGFVVRAGFLFKHDVRVPMASVAEIDDEKVRLSVTGEEAERQGRA